MQESDQLKQLWAKHVPEFESAAPKIIKYLFCLQNINQQVNLVSRKLDTETLFIDHIIDCGLAFPFFKDKNHIIDFGTGGGLPGMLAAICMPDTSFTLFDKSEKKMHYLQKIADELGLGNVSIETKAYQVEQPVDTLISRAVGPMDRILNLINNTLIQPQSFFFYKGKRDKIEEELNDIRDYNFTHKVHPLQYPDAIKSRHLVELIRNKI